LKESEERGESSDREIKIGIESEGQRDRETHKARKRKETMEKREGDKDNESETERLTERETERET